MHVAVIFLWSLSVLVALGIGGAVAWAGTILFGGSVALRFTKWRADERAEDEQSTEDEDEQDRLDALTIRNLMRVSARIARNEDALKTLQLGDSTALRNALRHAEDRFANWIDWAEGVSDAMNRLEPAEDGAAV